MVHNLNNEKSLRS